MNPPTDLARWRRIEAILDLALDLPSEERTPLLDEACAGDSDLRGQVEALLAADAGAGGFLGVSADEYAADLLTETTGEEEGLAGHQMGPYRLLREIGSGGMGTVYEAEDTRLGRRVALKLLPPEYSRDRRAKARFLREARAAAAVDHPNLCTIHDVGESDGRLYIVLSYYDGETLRERIRRGPLPLAEARDVTNQVARGLARAHEAGIVHRDIKPANVFLTRRGEVKILDFGIARLEGDEATVTRTGASWGTPAYMSPEQARGDSVDARTDIWSLGVMLYEMVAGRRPFGGESVEAVVSAILTQEPEPLERVRPDVPRELARVVESALAKSPAERYESAKEFLADLESGKRPAGLPARRQSKILRLIAGTLAILVLLITLLVWRPWQAPASPPLRVAVLQPVVELEGNHAAPAFVATNVMDAALAALISREGLQPLDPPERSEDESVKAQRLLEADEALLPVLKCRDDSCRVSLHRRKARGGTLKISDSFEVQAGFENAYLLAEGVQSRVQQVYSGYPLRPGLSTGSVRAEDYTAYAELQRRVDRGERLGKPELDRLDSLLRTSSGLVGAYELAIGIARSLGDIDRALDYAARAEKLAPYDPRPLFAHLRVELEDSRLEAASSTLARFEALAPGDIRVKTAKADLLEVSGELEEALNLREEVARRRPTWRYIRKLAILEFRLGESDSARHRLEALLAEQPNNQYLWVGMAAVESIFGDLRRAAELYEKLSGAEAAPAYTTSLGLIHYVLGEYDAAAAAYHRALALDPDNRWTRFDLATTLQAQGDETGARRLYRVLSKELDAAQPPLDEFTSMLRIQCLARLDRKDEATRLADAMLKVRPEEVQVLQQAAQVYALLGEPIQALYYMELALEKGMRREWFMIPEFHSLEKEPKFRDLLDLPPHRKLRG